MTLLLHERTQACIDDFLKHPSHAVMVTGLPGSGKRAIAEYVAASLLKCKTESLQSYPYFKLLQGIDHKAISIEQVREALKFLELRVPVKAEWNRMIIVEDAGLMTPEAQNAFLKTLEEPPTGTCLILTAASTQDVLPTIRSRSQQIALRLPSAPDAIAFFKTKGFPESAVTQAYAMSGGLPGLMTALLENNEHPLLTAAARARELATAPLFERLCLVDELAKQRELADNSLRLLQQMAHVSLQNKQLSPQQAARWSTIMAASYQAAEELAHQAQPKLVLTKLMLAL